jgi:hypothetical protein
MDNPDGKVRQEDEMIQQTQVNISPTSHARLTENARERRKEGKVGEIVDKPEREEEGNIKATARNPPKPTKVFRKLREEIT